MSRQGSGLELCIASGDECFLYTWDSENDEFTYLTMKDFSFNPSRNPQSLACADMDGTAFEDIVYCSASDDLLNPFRGLLVYDWDASSEVFSDTWTGNPGGVYPAAGNLAGISMIGYPFKNYRYQADAPASVINPVISSETNCDPGTCNASNLRYGVYADWDPSPSSPGADTFILPSEMQALAWNNIGQSFGSWPTDIYSDAELGSPISPTSLGNVNNFGDADVLFATVLDGICTLLAYDSDAVYPDRSDFPISLPDNVTSYGGFSIADIDRDGTVELVFGTSDGCLHCWELGSCSTGYAPWPQFRHDDGRTGVLE